MGSEWQGRTEWRGPQPSAERWLRPLHSAAAWPGPACWMGWNMSLRGVGRALAWGNHGATERAQATDVFFVFFFGEEALATCNTFHYFKGILFFLPCHYQQQVTSIDWRKHWLPPLLRLCFQCFVLCCQVLWTWMEFHKFTVERYCRPCALNEHQTLSFHPFYF